MTTIWQTETHETVLGLDESSKSGEAESTLSEIIQYKTNEWVYFAV
jgi:hypothetical protein